jgi:hypothetical protein
MINKVYVPDANYFKEIPIEESPINLDVLQEEVKKQIKRELWKGFYNVSIVGLRTPRKDNKVSDKFQDWIVLTWITKYGANKLVKDESRVWFVIPATTLAGTKYHKNSLNTLGTAQMALGYHKGIWKRGTHKGKPALTQIGNQVTVIRDSDGDDVHDFKGDDATTYIGWYGINFHTANKAGTSTVVGGWSAGCQVTNISQNLMGKLLARLKECEKYTAYSTYSYFLIEWQE